MKGRCWSNRAAIEDAMVRARVAELKGDEAADKLEAIQQQRPDASAGKGAPRQNEARPVQNY